MNRPHFIYGDLGSLSFLGINDYCETIPVQVFGFWVFCGVFLVVLVF